MTTLPTLIAAAGLVWLAVTPSHADTGALTALDRDGNPVTACPLEHTEVEATVSGFVARVVVTQRFTNPTREAIEALYTFPLSERAAVDAMEMRTGDRVIRGTVKEREEARRIYEAAKAAGKLAGLLDQERPNVFTQTIANLVPGAAVSVRIEYVEPLVFADGRFEFAFPTVVGPRFNPAGRVPDAGKVSPPITPEGTRAGHDIAIRVDVEAGVAIGGVTAPLHEVNVERPAPTRARVRLRERAEIPNRDFVLRWTVAGDAVRSSVLTHRRPGEDGYATFVLVPPARVPAAAAAPKELVFVVDRSGSQSGLPLTKAKETLHWILDHMNPNDTFQVVSFSNTTELLFDRPQPASLAMKAQARRYIDTLEANGGTHMAHAIERVCALPADDHRLRIVTFMTDGYVGNDFEILDLVRRLRGTSRWFPFGTGNAVNRFLIDGMAKLGGGEADYALLSESGEAIAKKFWQRIASPVLTDVRVTFDGLDVVQVLPDAPADVWAERPLVLQARYRRAGRGRVVLRGFRQGRPYEQVLDVTLPERDDAHGTIASMWARAKVDDLMARDLAALQSGTFPAPVRTAIVEVALAHKLVTQFTSFVAVEDRVVNEGGTVRTVQVPVEMPQGVRYEGIFGSEEADAEARGGAPRQAAPYILHSAPVGGAAPSSASGLASRSKEALSMADRAAVARSDDERKPVGKRARRKLDVRLVRLLEDGPQAPEVAGLVVDGWVRVQVVVANDRAETIRALEALGFEIARADGTTLTGLVPIDSLVPLADATAVVSVRPDVAVCG